MSANTPANRQQCVSRLLRARKLLSDKARVRRFRCRRYQSAVARETSIDEANLFALVSCNEFELTVGQDVQPFCTAVFDRLNLLQRTVDKVELGLPQRIAIARKRSPKTRVPIGLR